MACWAMKKRENFLFPSCGVPNNSFFLYFSSQSFSFPFYFLQIFTCWVGYLTKKIDNEVSHFFFFQSKSLSKIFVHVFQCFVNVRLIKWISERPKSYGNREQNSRKSFPLLYVAQFIKLWMERNEWKCKKWRKKCHNFNYYGPLGGKTGRPNNERKWKVDFFSASTAEI